MARLAETEKKVVAFVSRILPQLNSMPAGLSNGAALLFPSTRLICIGNEGGKMSILFLLRLGILLFCSPLDARLIDAMADYG